MGICTTSLKKACRRNGISRWPHKAYKIVNERMTKSNSTTFDQQMLDNEIQKLNEKKKTLFDDPAFATFRIRKFAKDSDEEKLEETRPKATNEWVSNGVTKTDRRVNGGVNSYEMNIPGSHPIHQLQNGTDHRNGNHLYKTTKFFLPHMITSTSSESGQLSSPIEISSSLPNPKLVQRLIQITTRLTKQNMNDSVNFVGLQPFYKSKARTHLRPLPPNLKLIDPREYFTIQEHLPPFHDSIPRATEPQNETRSTFSSLLSAETKIKEKLEIVSDESNEIRCPVRKRRKINQSLSRSY
jgi:hypothetical protein